MRVAVEPRAATPRQQLDELLAPHGLRAEAGSGRVILIVRDRSAVVRHVPAEMQKRPATGDAEPTAPSPLPPYLRLDARLQRTVHASRYAVTLFGEILNALNRRNDGLAEATLQPGTGEVTGFSRPLLSRRASFGIEVTLPR
jgi:hypothetical protein